MGAAALKIDHSGNTALTELPDGLTVGSLVLRGCTALKRLPRGLRATFLDLDGCGALERLPDDLVVAIGRLSLRGCAQVTQLPSGIGPLSQLDLADCSGIGALPERLVVTSWIDVGGSAVRALPKGASEASIRWRGVTIDARIAFQPETLTAAQALADPNAERRRVIIERMGVERFLREADAVRVDADRDAGGERVLFRVPLERDEDLVCLSVSCPSTGRRYFLRVPPPTASCRAAAAWLAGFDQPGELELQLET